MATRKHTRAARSNPRLPTRADLSPRGMVESEAREVARKAFKDAFNHLFLVATVHNAPRGLSKLKKLFVGAMREQLNWYAARS